MYLAAGFHWIGLVSWIWKLFYWSPMTTNWNYFDILYSKVLHVVNSATLEHSWQSRWSNNGTTIICAGIFCKIYLACINMHSQHSLVFSDFVKTLSHSNLARFLLLYFTTPWFLIFVRIYHKCKSFSLSSNSTLFLSSLVIFINPKLYYRFSSRMQTWEELLCRCLRRPVNFEQN